jgi:DedD protein
MPDHNLDDLIIDTIEPKNSKTKSFLTIIALAIVVLIIAIILTKIILKNPNAEVLAEENSTEIISPDLTLQAAIEEEGVVKKPLIPTTEEIKPEVHLEPVVKPISSTTKPAQTVEAPKEVASVETVKITNEFSQEENTRKEKEEAARIKALKEKQAAQEAKALAEKQEAIRLEEEQAKKAVDHESIVNPYFIQVGSFSKTPSERFLAVIKNSGFNYQITPPSTNGTKKLLIGPYKTKTEANNALVRVKDRINKSAYIIRK